MSLVLELDPQVQRELEKAFGRELGRTALEALIAEGYRSGKLARVQVQRLLGLGDRWAAEAWLKEHHAVPEITLEDVLGDAENSRRAREGA